MVEWQTHQFQELAGNREGSSPSERTNFALVDFIIVPYIGEQQPLSIGPARSALSLSAEDAQGIMPPLRWCPSGRSLLANQRLCGLNIPGR